jgi:hypothetical protein
MAGAALAVDDAKQVVDSCHSTKARDFAGTDNEPGTPPRVAGNRMNARVGVIGALPRLFGEAVAPRIAFATVTSG